MEQAKVGDRVACKCKGGPHSIIKGAPASLVDGIPVARVGDLCSCGAVIVSGLSWLMVDGKPAAIDGSATSCGGKVIAGSSSKTGSPKGGGALKSDNFFSPLPRYNERLRLLDPNGLPIANQRYVIVRQDGVHERGMTDQDGITHLVNDHGDPERIKVYLSLVERRA
ncbi:MAG: PAAR domain-containing protein [Halomonas sp.]|nr:PAAR domain-containing protein [Halomonas sp.]MCC5882111.1 PAAR domain-containing protein [Halomonas sp.]